jgi:hypothetical protein
METINNYLQYLNEGKDYKDADIPNPYDYQSIDLDPKVTKQDLNILGRWMKKNKKLLNPKSSLDPVEWLFYGNYREFGETPGTYEQAIKDRHVKAFTIIDKKKRVGVVAFSGDDFIWASWTPGRNYAVRGTMKMVEHLLNKDKKRYKNELWSTTIYTKNIPSLKVALKLKMKFNKSGDVYFCDLKNKDVWWLDEKKGWFKR